MHAHQHVRSQEGSRHSNSLPTRSLLLCLCMKWNCFSATAASTNVLACMHAHMHVRFQEVREDLEVRLLAAKHVSDSRQTQVG